MATIDKKILTVEVIINAPVEKVWTLWTDPKHIVRWNNASDEWYTPRAKNDLRVGGKFLSRMEAKDGSNGFDFSGEYDKIELFKQIDYTLADSREVKVSFVSNGHETTVKETFEAEQINPVEIQQFGWQSIMNNFKRYIEKSGHLELLHFEIVINSSAEIVYKTMLGKKTYSEWTSEFNPTSHFEGSWEKGSKIVFLGTDMEGKTGGMVSTIKENIQNRFLSIEHLGIIENGKEITSGPEVEGWAGMLENYTFAQAGRKTLLSVDIDSNQEFKSYFSETWPKALKKLKSICEKQ
jgi:uncharacterized protein YndB with AHSA1/START domain